MTWMGSFVKQTKICASSQSHSPQTTTEQNPIHFPFHETHRFFAILLNLAPIHEQHRRLRHFRRLAAGDEIRNRRK